MFIDALTNDDLKYVVINDRPLDPNAVPDEKWAIRMADNKKRAETLAFHLRNARRALDLNQSDLAGRMCVSTRQISRWENGVVPSNEAAHRLLETLSEAPDILQSRLRSVLGLAPPAPTVAQETERAAREQSRLSDARTSLEAVLLATSEERDVLPRHLRAFATKLLREVDRLGVPAKEAARMLESSERKETPVDSK